MGFGQTTNHEEQLLINMLIKRFSFLTIVVGGLILSACQTHKPATKAVVEDAAMYERTTQNKKFEKARSQLSQGKYKAAKKQLEILLKYAPEHKQARFYYKQLTQSSQQLFGVNKFHRYKVKNGEKLSSIASNWLGNADYWVFLAVSNEIPNPQLLTANKILKIPLVRNNPIHRKNKTRSGANLKMVKKMVAGKRLLKAVERISRVYVIAEHQSKFLKLEQHSLQQLHKITISDSGRIKLKNNLKSILRNARNSWSKSPIKDLVTTLEHNLLFTDAQNAYRKDEFLAAAKLLVQAKRYDPQRAQKADIKSMQQSLINKLHAQAMVDYRSQNLENALLQWQHVLLLDPTNILAKKYHARTRNLLEKLKRL